MAQDTLQAARERYTDATDAFREQRTRMVEDLKFSNPAQPEQWDIRARQIRENGPDGARPCLTLDHTNQYIAQVVNDARQNKPSINFTPSSGGARIEVARALDGIMRHIEYQSRAQIAYDTAVEHAARVGLGWIRLLPEVVDPELNYQEVRIKRVHDPLSIVCNPDWTEPDGADITYGFVESTLSHAAFKKKWPKASLQTWGNDQRASGWLGDNSIRVCEYFEQVETKTSRLVAVVDGQRRTMTEDEYWNIAGQTGQRPEYQAQYMAVEKAVKWRTMSGADILEETDFPSQYIPLVPMLGYEVWIEGKRYLAGMVRRMMEAQRAYNYERSAWVEAVALQPKAPMLADARAVAGHEAEWKRMNKSNQSYLVYNGLDDDGQPLPIPQRMQPPSMPAAFAQGANFANEDIKASVGMYGSNIGAPTQEHSGIAIRAKQREGDTANFHYIDNESRSIERVGRVALDMIPRIYDEAREARILGQDGSAKPVRIDPKGPPYAVKDQETTINLTTGTYDVRVKSGPSYTSLREEASEHLSQIMQGNPALAAAVAPIWARMQDWPEADKLAKVMLAMSPPQVQAALNEGQAEDPEKLKQHIQQLTQQTEQMGQALDAAGDEIEKLRDEDKKTTLEFLAKSAQIENDQYAKVTDRIKAMSTGMSPQDVTLLVQQLVQQALAVDLDEPGAPPMGDDQAMQTQQHALPPPEPPEPEPVEAQPQQPDQPPSGGFSLPEQPQEAPI